MKKKTEYDHIDRELSRTYFRGGTVQSSDNNKLNKFEPAKKSGAAKKQKARVPGKLKISASILLIAIIGLILMYFLRDKKVFFTIVESRNNGPVVTKTVRIGPQQIEGSASSDTESFVDAEPLFNFERNADGWEIPLWAKEKPDHVAVNISNITGMASIGKGSLEIYANFAGNKWTAAYIEIAQYLNFGNYDSIAADIYVPNSCPKGLKARFIVTAGENWRFIEMTRSAFLIPGKWTTLRGDISEQSQDWRRTIVNEDFRRDIRKLGIRIESNPKPAYSGPIYIDNIRLSKKKI